MCTNFGLLGAVGLLLCVYFVLLLEHFWVYGICVLCLLVVWGLCLTSCESLVFVICFGLLLLAYFYDVLCCVCCCGHEWLIVCLIWVFVGLLICYFFGCCL